MCDPDSPSGVGRWIISWRYFTSVFIKSLKGFRKIPSLFLCVTVAPSDRPSPRRSLVGILFLVRSASGFLCVP